MRKTGQSLIRSMAGDTMGPSPEKGGSRLNKENLGRSPLTRPGKLQCPPKPPRNPWGDLRSLVDSSLLTCSICLEQYSTQTAERSPRVLPFCGHTLCMSCLSQSLTLSKERIICHICKKPNPLEPYPTAINFPHSWTLMALLDEVAKLPTTPVPLEEAKRQAALCNTCRKHEVSHWCRHHATKLCAYCAFRHMKECRSEKMLELSALGTFAQETLSKAEDFRARLRSKIEAARTLQNALEADVAATLREIAARLQDAAHRATAQLGLYVVQLENLEAQLVSALGELSTAKLAIPAEDNLAKSFIRQLNRVEDCLLKNFQDFDRRYVSEAKPNPAEHQHALEAVAKLWNVNIESPYLSPTITDLHDSLFKACELGHLSIVSHLLNHLSLDVNRRDQSGSTPFCVALANKRTEVYRYLYEKHKADVNIQDNAGKTALIFSCLSNEEEAAQYLIRVCKADPNLRNKWKDTALHCAIEAGNTALVKLLIEETNVELNALNGKGKTPLDIARHEPIKQLLRKALHLPDAPMP